MAAFLRRFIHTLSHYVLEGLDLDSLESSEEEDDIEPLALEAHKDLHIGINASAEDEAKEAKEAKDDASVHGAGSKGDVVFLAEVASADFAVEVIEDNAPSCTVLCPP